MIYMTARMQPSKLQLDEIKKHADSSFCATSSAEFMTNFPTLDGWTADATASKAILLKLKNVVPHDDEWVGSRPIPKSRRAIFWLLAGGASHEQPVGVHFGCGRQTVFLKPGDFVVFNDAITHWVMSDKIWFGAAIQLRKSKS